MFAAAGAMAGAKADGEAGRPVGLVVVIVVVAVVAVAVVAVAVVGRTIVAEVAAMSSSIVDLSLIHI
eukprot:3424667-Prorocentrum_lima.AAC.1